MAFRPIIALFLMAISCTSIYPQKSLATKNSLAQSLSTDQQPLINGTETKNKSFFDYAATPLIVASAATLYYLTANTKQRENLLTQVKPQNLLINFITEYTKHISATLAHEAGHATAHKMITGKGCTIHIGSTQTTRNQKPLFTIGNIHIDGLVPTQGHVNHQFVPQEEIDAAVATCITNYCNNHKISPKQLTSDSIADICASNEFKAFRKSLLPTTPQYALFVLAGGMAGITANQLSKLLLKEKGPDSVLILQLLNMLIPCAQNSDGAAFLRDCAHTPEQVIQTLIALAPFIDIAAEIYCVTSDTQAKPNSPLHSQVLIGVINYFLRGYLRFHA
jgi:hypothetical protein